MRENIRLTSRIFFCSSALSGTPTDRKALWPRESAMLIPDPQRTSIMAKLTIGFGILLIALGIFSYVATGSEHPTALIPVGIGILFAFFGVMANTEDSKRRMLWMHISVTVALLVFLGMIPAMVDVFRLAHGVAFPYPAAVESKATLGFFSLIYVLFCVRSFINARRSRIA
jgi:hypothetical protein